MSDDEQKTPEGEDGKKAEWDAANVTVARVADTALGALISAAEALETAAKLFQEHGPAVAEAWETKGRPVRERIIESLRGAPFATMTTEPSKSETYPPTDNASAAEEISALERRVRELEQQVAEGAMSAATPAEGATINGEIGEGADRDSLADSRYAISETPEEQKRESGDDYA